jgi:hypothetical protein
MNISTRIEIERAIVKRIVRSALLSGYSVTVHDGDSISLVRSRSLSAVMAAVMTTDEDTLIFRDKETQARIGQVSLVYGNCGWDVISDCTDSKAMELLLADAVRYAETVEFQYC